MCVFHESSLDNLLTRTQYFFKKNYEEMNQQIRSASVVTPVQRPFVDEGVVVEHRTVADGQGNEYAHGGTMAEVRPRQRGATLFKHYAGN